MDLGVGDAIKKIQQVLPPNSNITVHTPLKRTMQDTALTYTILNTILTTVIAFLVLISTKLIYSLMISDVQEKTYEYGMLRSLGFNKSNLMMTIIVQAVSFALPGLLIGLTLSAVLNALSRHVLFTLTLNRENYYLSSPSIRVGVTIGTFVPLISNIFPIRKALGQNLRSSLDLYNRGKSET